MDKYENESIVEFRTALKAYHVAEHANREKFKAALVKYYGVENHPKVDTLWRLAWEHGHAEGLHNVAWWFDEMVVLL